MAFSEFTLESAVRGLGVAVREADLFPSLTPAALPDWLPGWLARGTRLALISEKARSEIHRRANPAGRPRTVGRASGDLLRSTAGRGRRPRAGRRVRFSAGLGAGRAAPAVAHRGGGRSQEK